MAKIVWDQTGERRYEAGVDHGVLYIEENGEYISGVPWNGLTSVDCNDDDRDITPLYSGNTKAAFAIDNGGCTGSINAYTYPDEFERCIGSERVLPGLFMQQQGHTPFGLCYRTFIGNDTDGQEHAFKIHLLYGLVVTKVSVSRPTINDSAEAIEFSWDYESIPRLADGYNSYSELIFDSREFDSEFMDQLLDILYGTEETAPRLPSFDELVDLFTVIDTSIPPEYEGYPYEYLYPTADYNGAETFTSGITFGHQTLEPGDVYPTTINPPGFTPEDPTVIPIDATIVDTIVEGVPEQYSGKIVCVWNLHSSRQWYYFYIKNVSDEEVYISETFVPTATVHYRTADWSGSDVVYPINIPPEEG